MATTTPSCGNTLVRRQYLADNNAEPADRSLFDCHEGSTRSVIYKRLNLPQKNTPNLLHRAN